MKIDGVTFDNVTISSCPHGEIIYDTPGSYTFIAPPGVSSISVVCVGGGGGGGGNGGGGGGGGALGYKNNYAVTPGFGYSVVVGNGGTFLAAGGDSYFNSAATVKGGGGGTNGGINGGAFVGDGGGSGGNGGSGVFTYSGGGGGGAGGYTAAGGNGGTATYNSVSSTNTGNSGAGGGGGGGGGGGYTTVNGYGPGGAGGGVGVWGIGPNGQGGADSGSSTASAFAKSGTGGSYGNIGTTSGGGLYGGGGGASDGAGVGQQSGTRGAVRIIWPGQTRSFPSTNAGRSAEYGAGLPNGRNALGEKILQIYYDPQDSASFPGTTTYNDISGNAINATFSATPTRDTTATVSHAGALYASTAANTQYAGFNSSVGLSVSVWIKVSSISTYQYIFDKRGVAGTGGQALAITTAGKLEAYNGSSVYAVSTATLSTGIWYNVTLVWSTSEILSYYVNGALSSSPGGVGTMSVVSTSLVVGANGNNSLGFYGQMGQFMVYRSALSATDVAYIYNTTKWRYGL